MAWMKPEASFEGISPLPIQEICRHLPIKDILSLGLVSKKVRRDTCCFIKMYKKRNGKKNFLVNKDYMEEIVSRIPNSEAPPINDDNASIAKRLEYCFNRILRWVFTNDLRERRIRECVFEYYDAEEQLDCLSNDDGGPFSFSVGLQEQSIYFNSLFNVLNTQNNGKLSLPPKRRICFDWLLDVEMKI